jgi:hypothetical protein
VDQEPSVLHSGHGVIITTKLQQINDDEEEDDEEDKNNVGFEKLSGDGDKVGLFVLKNRKSLVHIIKKQKVRKDFILISLMFFIIANRLW